MDYFYEIEGAQLQELYAALRFADKTGLRKLRIFVSDEGVKLKVNEFTWSPPFGKKVKGS